MELKARVSRRSFLGLVAAGAAGTAVAGLAGACSSPTTATPTSAPAAAATSAPAPAAPAAAPTVVSTSGTKAASGGFDWQRYKGKTVRMILNKHPYTDSILPLLPQFEQQTGIKTTNLILPETEFFQKLLVDLSTGAGEYDVYMTGPYTHWAYDKSGWEQPLDDFLADPNMTAPDYDAADLFKPLMDFNRWDLTTGSGVGKGHLWAIPVQVETYVQVYRKDIYDQLGIKPATTIEDWRANNKKATSGNVKGIVVRGIRDQGGVDATGFVSTFLGYGGQVVDQNMVCQINSPIGVHIAQEYCASVKESGPAGWTNVQWYEGQEGYASGLYAQYMDCDFFEALYEDPTKSKVVGKNALAFCPHAPDHPPVSSMWTWALGMSSKAQDKNASWYFIQWATRKEQMLNATLKGLNYNPTRQSVFQNADVQKIMGAWGNGTYLPTVQDNLSKYAISGWPPEPEFTYLQVRWNQALQEIWGGSNAQQSLDSAKADIDNHNKQAGLLK